MNFLKMAVELKKEKTKQMQAVLGEKKYDVYSHKKYSKFTEMNWHVKLADNYLVDLVRNYSVLIFKISDQNVNELSSPRCRKIGFGSSSQK